MTMTEHPESVEPVAAALTLSIVQLDHSISQIDRPIVDASTCVLNYLSCTTPSNALDASPSKSSCPASLRENVNKSIMRYRRDQDRWTSFTSLLLKSMAFYRSVDPTLCIPSKSTARQADDDDPSTCMEKLAIRDKQKLAIVDLPRTKYNRPYLPLDEKSSSSNAAHEELNENCNSMMNVSHQYPWVCMAQQQLHSPKSSILIGLDVVIFDARLGKFRPTVDDFLKSFVGSFTPWEWERITHRRCPSPWSYVRKRFSTRARGDDSKLREFFLRWSMKEAYTKALGLGMNINFNEFETRLCGVDDDAEGSALEEQDEGIWTSTMKGDTDCGSKEGNGQRQFSVVGKVKRASSLAWERWEFLFIPLGDGVVQDMAQDMMVSQSPRSDAANKGCACICRGPLARTAPQSSERASAAIELLTVVDLIQLHGSNPL